MKARHVAPRCPAWLKGDAKQIWKAYAGMLEDCGVLTEGDFRQLADLCILEARVHQVTAELLNQSVMVEDFRGNQVPNPLIKLEADLLQRVRMMRSDFGLNPSARTKVDVQPVRQKSEMEKLIG